MCERKRIAEDYASNFFACAFLVRHKSFLYVELLAVTPGAHYVFTANLHRVPLLCQLKGPIATVTDQDCLVICGLDDV